MTIYLIAVLADRIQAEAASIALTEAGLTPERVSILGKGYKSADEFGLIDPNQQAKEQILRMVVWLSPFGFASGYLFNLQTGIQLFDWAGVLGNHIIGGIFGAIAGAMGAIFVGGGVGLSAGSGDALPYRNRLNSGKYLIVVAGSDADRALGTRVLRQFEPENLQGYVELPSAGTRSPKQ
ncbi:hypothetical protein KR51_00035900 [Rubidibacter lacunae KORDI 51-2]|uniref:DUF1269 domain-containing protein n=1 Tax=Rubidibacter lacunae KORDI 51-2 TaxID=582515 RepID=U5DHE0_9CHRO|nr:hypothetical protein [Rubidibacter lacunae]ERN39989.1 hypothetical protein KR51_00035900 [Rubidibacter lacunae KORDI 51-2]